MKFNTRFFALFLMASVAQVFTCSAADSKISFDSVPVTGQFVAITFNDGPSSMLTPQVLKILLARNIKATFFAVGEEAQSHPELLHQEVVDGHEVGSRGWQHNSFAKTSDAQWHSDMARTDQAIKVATGRSPRYFCPFDLQFTDQDCTQMNSDFGYKVIYWNVDSLAVKAQGAAAVANVIISQVKPGSIILSSDIDIASVQALPTVLDTLTSKGYKFVTVSQLIALGTPMGMKKYLADNPDAAPKPAADSPAPATTSGETAPTGPHTTSSGGTDAGFHPFGVSAPSPGMSTSDTGNGN